jgi:hypothetical protein
MSYPPKVKCTISGKYHFYDDDCDAKIGGHMTIKRTMILKLSKEELVKIVKEHIKNEGFMVYEKDISFDVTEEWRGYGQDEHKEVEFKGCTVTCEGFSNEVQI